MPLSGLRRCSYVAIVQSTGVTALTFSASRFDLDQCAPSPETKQERQMADYGDGDLQARLQESAIDRLEQVFFACRSCATSTDGATSRTVDVTPRPSPPAP
jgi:hypothetical protein